MVDTAPTSKAPEASTYESLSYDMSAVNVDLPVKSDVKYALDMGYRNEQSLKSTESNTLDPQGYLAYMSEDEKKTLKSYADSGDWTGAKDYLSRITTELTKRQRENRRTATTEFAQKAPVLASAANILSAPAQAVSFLPVAGAGIASAVTGKDIKLDPNSDMFAASQGIEDTQTGIDKAIEDKLGTGDTSKTAKFLANTGLSIGRVAAAAPFGQTGALTLMSGAQAGQSAYDILQRGGDTKQAAADLRPDRGEARPIAGPPADPRLRPGQASVDQAPLPARVRSGASVVLQLDGVLSRTSPARRTLARISSALAVQVKA
jgi:hypothetical protein